MLVQEANPHLSEFKSQTQDWLHKLWDPVQNEMVGSFVKKLLSLKMAAEENLATGFCVAAHVAYQHFGASTTLCQ